MQWICGPFVLATIIMPFERLFVLRHSLITLLYFIQIYIFVPLIQTSSHFNAFHTFFTFHQLFHMYNSRQNILLIPDIRCRWSVKARNKIFVFNYNYNYSNNILLSNFYSQRNLPWNLRANLLQFTMINGVAGTRNRALVTTQWL